MGPRFEVIIQVAHVAGGTASENLQLPFAFVNLLHECPNGLNSCEDGAKTRARNDPEDNLSHLDE
jgi:hypothetical protein